MVTRLTIYLAFALLASVAVNTWQLYHAGTMKPAAQAAVAVVADANVSAATTIRALQDANVVCLANRVADQKATSAALIARDADRATLEARYKAVTTALAESSSGTCKSWANEPACGVTIHE